MKGQLPAPSTGKAFSVGEMAYLVGGRAVSLPVVVRSAKIAFANYMVSVDDAYRFVADSGLQPCEVTGSFDDPMIL